jgi:tetratricopeptide (TPR) repeat protein
MVRAGVLAALLLLAVAGDAAAQGAAPRVGGYAPLIQLEDLNGAPVKIAWPDGGPAATIVYFFDPQSPNCLLQMSFLDALFLRARDFGLAVYAVEAKGRQPAEISRTMERYCAVYHTPSFPVATDPSFRAGRTYGVQIVPTTFVTESHGVVLNRIEGYDHGTAVALTRRVEQLLRREHGYFSSALREGGVDEEEEHALEARLEAAAAAADAVRPSKALGSGDRAPAIEFTDLAGAARRWDWAGGPGGVRVILFWGGLELPSIEEMSWLGDLALRGRDAGLEVVAIEASGLDAAGVGQAMQRYAKIHGPPPFPVVPDPGKSLSRLFGPWDRLPQTYLIGLDGVVVHHADGFTREEAAALAGKVEKAFLLSGRPLPAAPAAPELTGTAPPAGVEEAPSIRQKRELEERYRSNIIQGDAAFMSWDFAGALPFYLKALEAQPRDLHALERAAQISERRGETEAAAEYWRRVLQVSPGHAEAQARLKELRPAFR